MTSRTGPPGGHLDVAFADDGEAFRVVLRGEADVASVPVLRRALTEVAVDGADRVELDLSGVGFLDIAALRQLTLFAMRLQENGYEVRTHGAQPVLAHLITLVGAHDKLGLDPAADGQADGHANGETSGHR